MPMRQQTDVKRKKINRKNKISKTKNRIKDKKYDQGI